MAQGVGGRYEANFSVAGSNIPIWPVPKAANHSRSWLSTRPRRGRVDTKDRLWFAAFGSGHIGMFDPVTEKFAAYKPPTPWANPYDVEADKNGEVWAGSMLNDRLTRLDPKNGTFVDYLLPGQFSNIRRIFVDNKTEQPTIWIGDNHGANVVHVEPLD